MDYRIGHNFLDYVKSGANIHFSKDLKVKYALVTILAALLFAQLTYAAAENEKFTSGIIGDGNWRGDLDILPDNPKKYEQNSLLFIGTFLLTIAASVALIITRKKIFGKTLGQYTRPIKYHILISILVVIFQYAVALPLSEKYRFALNLTQAAWALMVALSVYKVTKEHKFGIKQACFLGVIYSIIIHGLKVSIRHFFYGMPIYYLLDRFVYGSFLVFAIVLPLGLLFVFLKKKGIKF